MPLKYRFHCPSCNQQTMLLLVEHGATLTTEVRELDEELSVLDYFDVHYDITYDAGYRRYWCCSWCEARFEDQQMEEFLRDGTLVIRDDEGDDTDDDYDTEEDSDGDREDSP